MLSKRNQNSLFLISYFKHVNDESLESFYPTEKSVAFVSQPVRLWSHIEHRSLITVTLKCTNEKEKLQPDLNQWLTLVSYNLWYSYNFLLSVEKSCKRKISSRVREAKVESWQNLPTCQHSSCLFFIEALRSEFIQPVQRFLTGAFCLCGSEATDLVLGVSLILFSFAHSEASFHSTFKYGANPSTVSTWFIKWLTCRRLSTVLLVISCRLECSTLQQEAAWQAGLHGKQCFDKYTLLFVAPQPVKCQFLSLLWTITVDSRRSEPY